MAKPLCLDRRERVVAAVEGGLSRRQAAERFGGGVASAIRWCALAGHTGTPHAKPQGGDRRSQRIEAERDFILELVTETRDMTLVELQGEFAAWPAPMRWSEWNLSA